MIARRAVVSSGKSRGIGEKGCKRSMARIDISVYILSCTYCDSFFTAVPSYTTRTYVVYVRYVRVLREQREARYTRDRSYTDTRTSGEAENERRRRRHEKGRGGGLLSAAARCDGRRRTKRATGCPQREGPRECPMARGIETSTRTG